MSILKAGLLYRKCLKWVKVQGLPFELMCEEAQHVRDEFEKYRYETDPSKIQFLFDRAEYWLNELEPAIPYTIPNFPGGSSWLRNPQLDMDYVKSHSGIYDYEVERDRKQKEYGNLYKNK
jgi:hypothetical protein